MQIKVLTRKNGAFLEYQFYSDYRDHPLFSAFSKEHREYAIGGGGKSSCTHAATVPVHETSLTNQHF